MTCEQSGCNAPEGECSGACIKPEPQTECDTCYNASCDKRDGSCDKRDGSCRSGSTLPHWQEGLAEAWAAENHKPLPLRHETIGDYVVRTAPAPRSAPDPLEVQVGGGHYKGLKIQPAEFIHANGIGFLEGCIIKRACRWRGKGGVQDLEKIKHEVDLLIELERRHG